MSKADWPSPPTSHAQHEVAKKAQDLKTSNEASKSGILELDQVHEGSTERSQGVRLLRRPAVEARTGLSRSTLYDWMKRGQFPHPVKLGARIVAWRESDVNAWLETRTTRVG